MSIKINAQTVVFKGQSFIKTPNQDNCEYCQFPFKKLMVVKASPDPSVKTEVPIKVNGETFNYCPHCGRNLQG
ncbi:hypothetical protein FOD75_03175 [Limosilactobacillus reuteri]|uniref:Uncharacterized protein n=1 Tax=Limosilactobacillus reuteri TaxID=1598 RepID=A0A517D480_LIMRT|nr:hypothetical protein [Limosilactobacillus reuteri]QDR72161.1 hypothetical protein FOD75_03175 [Limosilactobacillus reuteri]